MQMQLVTEEEERGMERKKKKGQGKGEGEGNGEGKWGKRKGIGRKISCASRVIAHFVPNFVAMAMGVGWGKTQLAAFDGPSPKTPI